MKPRTGGPGAEPPPLRLISSGPLTWEQGFEHSVHAVRLLLDMGVECTYRLLGEGLYLVAVAFARHQLGLAERVDIVSPSGGGPLVDELRRADVFVDPAVTDTTSPSPLATAHALGIPFVATHREALPENGGIAVPRRSARAIAEALHTLAQSPRYTESS